VGLDPLVERLPAGISRDLDGVLAFSKAIVTATAPSVAAYKPQAAHFGSLGGEEVLAELIRWIHDEHPDRLVILDAKRGDIGSTAERYAVEVFERYGADAVTVNPFLGDESVEPYLEHSDRGVIALCRTSNKGSDWLQLQPEDDPVYLQIARRAVQWNRTGNVGLVVGATWPEEMEQVRREVGDMPILVPGVGAQGGRIDAVVAAGADSRGEGLLISASRSILFASSGEDFAAAAGFEAERMKQEIQHERLKRNR
jgi:orotidine-5'-phosphate decarboxylase